MLILLKKVKTIFGNSLVLLLSDELEYGKIKHTQNNKLAKNGQKEINKYIGDALSIGGKL